MSERGGRGKFVSYDFRLTYCVLVMVYQLWGVPSKSNVSIYCSPTFWSTLFDPLFSQSVISWTSFVFRLLKAYSSEAIAVSVAYPFPQCSC